jgi:hypothetical protein
MSFARSVSLVVPLEHGYYPHGSRTHHGAQFLWSIRGHGHISAYLAKQAGLSEDDLALLWKALIKKNERWFSAAISGAGPFK